MHDFTLSKKTSDNINLIQTRPSKRRIQNILDYSKTMQVKSTKHSGILFFMNN